MRPPPGRLIFEPLPRDAKMTTSQPSYPVTSVLTSTQTHDANGIERLGEAAMPRIKDTLASQEMWDLHFADDLDLLWGDLSTQPSLLIPPFFLSTLPPAPGKTWRALQPDSASHREAVPWRISQEDHEVILDHLQSHSSTLPPGFIMPSRHALCRYVEGFFTGFHEHLPCLHTPTFTLANSAPELAMAIAATGARYRFQRQQADTLYRAAMALLEAQLRRRDSNSFSSAGRSSSRDLQTMQAMILLIALGTWNQRSVLREAFATASQLATMVREQGLTRPATTRPESLTWHDWIAEEGARRVKIVAYSFSNLHSIAYNIPPKLTTAEMGPVQLPAPETHWRAADEAAWHAARNKDVHVESSFAKSYSALFVHVADAAEQSTVSSFGNYVLMHGIIQQIFLVRQSSFPFASSRGDTRLPDEILEGLDTALRRWQRQWEMTRDSSLDPLAPGGPLSFNATALFRLAYIRLYADLGSYRHLDTRDPGAIARGLREVPLLDRFSHVERAALQAAHSLSIPVHIGVEYVAQTQTLSWSIVHSLCNVECAIYLSKWLETVAMALAEGKELRTGERSIVSIVASIINETDLGPLLLRETNSIRRIRRMAAAVVRLWACTFQGAHVFEIMGTIGAGLDLFADMLQQTVTNDKETGPA
ncbi:hypothetical protein Micbo1qcDRAFT_189783 [Microdochium bolleyi]|uniref:Xylanolytic transcriptional activator regulatory domain-containing protein n=1 Tax=Microdochium bolleyi TaxID=196109 RepID=A0A136IV12_9PEZI|nr:hypothetical protein Micbo1qcDRAFT_189783 [Microdochium bolleyi]